jgi:excisionase family DNA binding protein
MTYRECARNSARTDERERCEVTQTTGATQAVCEPHMLRIEEAARLSGLGRTKFLQLVYAGEVPGVARFGRAVRVNRRLLEAWLDERSGAAVRQSA